MTLTTAAKEPRKCIVMESGSMPVAVKLKSNNTEIYSAFSDKNLIIFLKTGSIKLFNKEGSFSAATNECFLIPSYSDYKVQRILDRETQDFESINYVIPDSFLQEGFHGDASSSKSGKLISVFKIVSDLLVEIFKHFDDYFVNKKGLPKKELIQIGIRINRILQTSLTKQMLTYRKSDLAFLSYLHRNINNNLTIEELATKYGLSRSSFYRLFAREIGVSPHKWIKDHRLHHARCEMQLTQKTVSEIYLNLGFEDMAHFSKEFKKKFGYNPSAIYNTALVEVIK